MRGGESIVIPSHVLSLSYHYVRNGEAPGLSCAPDHLRAQLVKLRDAHWEVLTCGEVAERLRSERPLPERAATLSFDDGLKDHAVTVLPMLREFGVPATFFIIGCTLDGEFPPVMGLQVLIRELGTHRLEHEILPEVLRGTLYATLLDPGRYDLRDAYANEPPEVRRVKWVFNHGVPRAFRRDLMREILAQHLGEATARARLQSWFLSAADVQELISAGMEVGSHSMTHPAFTTCAIDEVDWEVREAAQRLRDVTARPVPTFCWPFGGQFRPAVRDMVARHHQSAWNYSLTGDGPVRLDDPYDLPRIDGGTMQF